MTTHIFLETTAPLLHSFESLALQHKKNSDSNYHTAFPLLIINASIVEGILRYWLVGEVKKTMNKLVEEGVAAGRNSKNKAELLLENYLIEIEGNGGFEKLKAQYKFFFSVPFDRNSSDYRLDTIQALFTLRNVLAHGTAIVAPKNLSSSPNKQDYADSWQSRLQSVTVILKSLTGCDDIFAALNDAKVPSYFFENSVSFIKSIRSKLPDNMDEGKAFKEFQAMSFGYRNPT
jgi:hypothetical protein